MRRATRYERHSSSKYDVRLNKPADERQPTDPARIRYLANDWEYYSSLRIAIKCAHITVRIFTEGGVKIDVVVECLETGRAWLVAPDGTLVEQSQAEHTSSPSR